MIDTSTGTKAGLERRIGLRSAVLFNMLEMIGVGPFITLPLVIAAAGFKLSVWAWVLGAAIAVADGLVWAELGAAFPRAGGSYAFLREHRRRFQIRAFVEQRIRIAPRTYRVPDVCVYKEPAPRDRIFSTPPFIAIEILSPEDRMSRVRKKIDEFLAFGVPYVWVIDPETRRADVYTASGFYEAKDGVLRTEDPAIEVPLADLFQALDD